MAKPVQLHVKEDFKELRKYQRSAGVLIKKRMTMLIVIKEHEQEGGISKRELSRLTGINHNSIVKWRNIYKKQGITPLLKHNRIGFKRSILNDKQREEIRAKLSDPTNGLIGYKELQIWIEEELGVKLKYTTLYQYCKRNFKSKIKVARKSHIKKDKQAGEDLKKTSVG